MRMKPPPEIGKIDQLSFRGRPSAGREAVVVPVGGEAGVQFFQWWTSSLGVPLA